MNDGNMPEQRLFIEDWTDQLEDEHIATSIETPLRDKYYKLFNTSATS